MLYHPISARGTPEHGLKTKDRILELTGLPVACEHELSQELGAYERAVKAFLNAQLIPITRQFVQSIIKDIKERGINARLLMLKCDGSVVGIKDALQEPIETISQVRQQVLLELPISPDLRAVP